MHLCTVKFKQVFAITFKINQDEKDKNHLLVSERNAQRLGDPLYLVSFVNVAKVLGIIAILIPGFPGIKKWGLCRVVLRLCWCSFFNLLIRRSRCYPGLHANAHFIRDFIFSYYRRKQNSSQNEFNFARSA